MQRTCWLPHVRAWFQWAGHLSGEDGQEEAAKAKEDTMAGKTDE